VEGDVLAHRRRDLLVRHGLEGEDVVVQRRHGLEGAEADIEVAIQALRRRRRRDHHRRTGLGERTRDRQDARHHGRTGKRAAGLQETSAADGERREPSAV
jgi:hypothetical protein